MMSCPCVAPFELGRLIPECVCLEAGLAVNSTINDVQDQSITGYLLVVLHFYDVALFDLAPGAAFEVPTLHLVSVLFEGQAIDLLSDF